MAIGSNFRHIRGEGNNVWMPSGSAIFVSDLLVQTIAREAVPADDVVWDTDAQTTQRNAAAAFLGAANDQIATAQIGDDVSICVEGVHEYPQDDPSTASDATVGDWVTFAVNDDGDGLEPQKVAPTTDEASAIGKYVKISDGTTATIRLFGSTAQLA